MGGEVDGIALHVRDAGLAPDAPRATAATGEASVTAPTFRKLFDEYLPAVFRALRRLGVAERDLEDQAHEVFLIVHRRLSDYDPSRPFRPWLLGICYRRALDYRRLVRHGRESLMDSPDAPAAGPTPEELVAERQSWRLLNRALDRLPEEKRAALVLHDLEGLSLAEVATVTGAPLQTVYSRIRSARELLSEAVKERPRGEEAKTR
jgi:RNA polymerase sigma-70 factor (ECF subfamily)